MSIRETKIDPSVVSLVTSNLIAGYWSWHSGQALEYLMWVYWFQNIIIGFTTVLRLLRLKSGGEMITTINGVTTKKETTPEKAAIFFIGCFGGFQLVSLIAMGNISLEFNPFDPDTWGALAGSQSGFFWLILIFFANHLFSYLYNRKNDDPNQEAGSVMGTAVYRIVPLHLVLVLGMSEQGFFSQGFFNFWFFIILKTMIDVGTHLLKHGTWKPAGRKEQAVK